MRSTIRSSLTLALALSAAPAFGQEPYDQQEDEGPPEQVFVDEQGNEYVEEEGYVEDGYAQEDGYADDGTAGQGEFVQSPAPQGQQQPPQPERLGRQLSLALDVPIFLTNTSFIHPGVGAHARFGWEFGYVVPQIKLGVATNFLSEDVIDATNLNSLWATIGLRLQILNPSRFVPVIDAGLRLQFWSYASTDAAYAEEYRFDPGVSVGGGLAIEITARFGLEVGVDATVTFPVSDTFDVVGFDNRGVQFFLTPHVGGTLYF